MPKISEKRRAEIEAAVKRKAVDAVWDIVKTCHPDKLTINLFSMNEIARKAGVAKGTLYNYFKDKADLMAYIVLKVMGPYSEQEMKIKNSAMPLRDKLLAIAEANLSIKDEMQRIQYIMTHNRTSMPAMQKVYNEIARRTEQRIAAIIEEGLSQGVLGKFALEDITNVFIGTINSYVEAKLHHITKRSVEEKAETAVDIFMKGACVSQDNASPMC